MRSSGAIIGQFTMRPIEMLRSPPYRVLSLTGHRILARLEIEHARHGGKDNGKLPITHEDFRQFGIDRKAIAPGLREVYALGFIEQTQRGLAGIPRETGGDAVRIHDSTRCVGRASERSEDSRTPRERR